MSRRRCLTESSAEVKALSCMTQCMQQRKLLLLLLLVQEVQLGIRARQVDVYVVYNSSMAYPEYILTYQPQ
jgi:hypothetical protein